MLFDRNDKAKVITSSDGDVWQLSTLPTDGLDKLNYFDDGKVESVAYGNGIYLTLATNNQASPARTIVSTSSDGITWNVSLTDPQVFDGSPSGYTLWSAVAFGAGKFVITYYKSTGAVGIVTTTDGSSLTYQGQVIATINSSVVYVNGYFFLLSYGTISDQLKYSQDGVSWATANLPYAIVQHSIIYAFGKWTMVDAFFKRDRIFVSADILVWSQITTGFGNMGNGGLIVGADGLIIASGQSNVIYSDDGVIWHTCTGLGDNNLGQIIYSDGTYIATYPSGGSLHRAICP